MLARRALPGGPDVIMELVLILLVAVFAGLAWRMLRRLDAGSTMYWVFGWVATGISGLLVAHAGSLPWLSLLTFPLGSLFAALLLAGAFVFAQRSIPAWLMPAALVVGALRAALAARGRSDLAYLAALPVEPPVVAAAGVLVARAVRGRTSSLAEQLLGPALWVLAAMGAVHLAVLAGSEELPGGLLAGWLVVGPPIFGLQIQAGADRIRGALLRARERLEERVAERTAALARSEERYRTLSEISSDLGFQFTIDRDLNLRRDWVAGAFAGITGHPPEALDGRGWLELLPLDARQEVSGQWREAHLRRALSGEFEIRHRDGSTRWLEIRLGRLQKNAEGAIEVTGSAQDVSRRRQAEQERRRLEVHMQGVQKLESLGILAGGIAHDFNNLLTVIRGNAQLAEDDIADANAVQARLERISSAAEHASALTDQLLTYAGKPSVALELVDLSQLVARMLPLLRASLGDRCRLETDLPGGLPCIEGDAGRLRQVILNLVINGWEAIGEERGCVSVRSGTIELDASILARTLGSSSLEPGRCVYLEVRDDGAGMDGDTAGRIFEPFFSTKFAGRGLGLPSVLGIVQAHGGAISVDTAPGEGTRMRVFLPPSAGSPKAAERGASAAAGHGATAEASGTVLLVDDDEGVLDLGRELLERAGIHVIAVVSGKQAVAAIEHDGARIDLAVVDLAMPEMDGEETFRELRARRAGLPVILVSGYDAERTARRFGGDGPDDFLRKPYEPEQLVARVRAALAAGPRKRAEGPPGPQRMRWG